MEEKIEYVEDGCNYLSEEEAKLFFAKSDPGLFDRSSIKNKLLDIRYGTLESQLLDIYYPDSKAPGDAPYPVIFFIHGGGWSLGCRYSGSIRGIIDAIKHGYVVIAVEYRLYPQFHFPEFIYDIKTAVRFARANADKYNFDPEHFGMIGDSAGGFNTLMAGFTADRPEYQGYEYGWEGYSSSLQVICDQYGNTDLNSDDSRLYRESGVKRAQKKAVGQSNALHLVMGTSDPGLLALCSPINMIDISIPPVLIMQGRQDAVVAYQHSTLLAEKIERICGPDRVKLLIYEDINHSDPMFYSPDNAVVVLEFFDKYLK